MRHANKILAAMVVAVALAYVGLYYATVEYAELEFRIADSGSKIPTFKPEATYRFGGRAAQLIFCPIHELDRRLRPWTWDEAPMPLIY